MNLLQAFKMAFKSTWNNKGRSILTMLGIIIGVASVMTITSVLQGQSKKQLEYFQAMGTNTISVSAAFSSGRSVFDDLYEYCLQLDDLVEGVTPNSMISANIAYGNKNSQNMGYSSGGGGMVMGYSADAYASVQMPPDIYLGSDQFSLCNNFTLGKGRDISKLDVDNYNAVCVMGSRAAEIFFDLTDPVGKVVQINGKPFTVIGVYKQKDFSTGPWSLDNIVAVPYTNGRLLGTDSNYFSQFTVKAKNRAAMTEATTRIIGFLTGLIGDPNNPQTQKGYFSVSSDAWQDDFSGQMQMASLVMGGIAAISLLVGGIGIMNIMLVTVTERTKEIGIRRAIGAQRKSIVTQFLIEAGVICGIGGVFGILLGTVLTLVASKSILKTMMFPSPVITIGAVLFSVALGIIFGLYPAIKASGLQPVVALRSE